MPGTEHVAPGSLKGKGERMLQKVYESARSRGYSKARSAKQAWGAVKRAGYDPDHFDYEIEMLKEIIRQLEAKDEYLDMQAERLGLEYDPSYIVRSVTGGARHARSIGRGARRVASTVRRLTPTRRPRTASRAVMRHRGPLDPAKLTQPIDLPGYDNASTVRLVPTDDTPGYYPTRGLVEGQIVQPQQQFLKTLEVINQDPNYGHVELTDEDGDGYIDRWIARGPKDASNPTKGNVNIFGDIAKPLRSERLKVENWSLQ